MRKATYIAAVVTGMFLLLHSCEQKPAEKKPENTFAVNGNVREINIWLETPDFPQHEGRGEFMSYWAMCHSLKYVTMQPNFSRKVWEAEVHKMVVKYKAPIDSVTGKKIVDYILLVKKPDPKLP